ncbi:MAG: hypothetical protein ACREJC_19985, partial [Tepidisphaeraceae bacterium]
YIRRPVLVNQEINRPGTTRSRQVAGRDLFLVGVACFFVFAYFYQGEGWSQNSHFYTIRSIVERGTFEITPFESQTGDISNVNGRIYSNKPPGLPLLGAPIYWLLRSIESDPSAPGTELFNKYLLTLLLSGVPAALLVVMLCSYFRRGGADGRTALLLAGGFAFGSLVFPYSGMLFNHVIVAALLFAAWLLVSSDRQCDRRALLAGLLLGVAALTEYLAGPLVLLYLVYEIWKRRNLRRAALMCVGPALALLGLLVYHQVNFGSALTPSYVYDNPEFVQKDLPLGKFSWPDLSRLYYLSYHRMRGLFVCCPVFMLPVLSLLLIRRRPRAEEVFALALTGYFVLFLLCYHYWAGGWGVGPRFLIPALAFIFIFARPAFERFPKICGVFILLSILNMLAVTSVQAMYPGHDTGPPRHFDPIGVCLQKLWMGQLAQGEQSFNLGMLMGLKGWASLAPPVALIVVFYIVALRGRRIFTAESCEG